MIDLRVLSNRKEWLRQAIEESKVFTAREVVENLNTMMLRRTKRMNRDQFLAEGRGGHGKWKPLSPRYAEWKARHYPGKTILRRTDRLFRAATTRGESGHQGGKTSRGYSFTHFIFVPYARYHQEGGGRLPKRPIYDPNERQQKAFTGAIGRTIVEGLFRRKFFERHGSVQLTFRDTGFDRIEF